MNRKDRIRCAVIVLFTTFTIPAFVHKSSSAVQQTNQAGQSTQPATPHAQQDPKNLQVLKGMSRQQVIAVMQSWSKDLGVECSYCHVRPFEADTPRKEIARLMQRQFVQGLKQKDDSPVSCQTCHRGQADFLPEQHTEETH